MIEIVNTGISDTTPAGLADLVDGLAQGVLGHDREAASILIHARENLRTLGYQRWARQTSRRSMARSLRTRHHGRKAVRHA